MRCSKITQIDSSRFSKVQRRQVISKQKDQKILHWILFCKAFINLYQLDEVYFAVLKVTWKY